MKTKVTKLLALLFSISMLLGVSATVMAAGDRIEPDPYTNGLQVIQGANAEIGFRYYMSEFDKYGFTMYVCNSNGDRVSNVLNETVTNRHFEYEYLSFTFPTSQMPAGTYHVYAYGEFYSHGSWWDLSAEPSSFTFQVVKQNSSLNGLAQATDGNYYYYKKGKIDTSFTGFTGGKEKLIYVINGVADFSFYGAVYDPADGKWKCVDYGLYVTDVTGVAPAEDGTMYYFNNGEWDRSYTGMAIDHEGQEYYVENGIGAKPCEKTGGAHTYNNSICTGCGKLAFNDVPKGEWFYDPVIWAVNNKITNGLNATTFGPYENCNRAQVVTFLWRAAGSPKPVSSANPFKDVERGQWYTDAVLWAVEKGITTGMTSTTFEPFTTCNRAQIATFMYRADGSPAISGSVKNPFTDVPAGQWYTNAVLWAVENGITNGVTPTAFAPFQNCTRGQIVTFLYRAR